MLRAALGRGGEAGRETHHTRPSGRVPETLPTPYAFTSAADTFCTRDTRKFPDENGPGCREADVVGVPELEDVEVMEDIADAVADKVAVADALALSVVVAVKVMVADALAVAVMLAVKVAVADALPLALTLAEAVPVADGDPVHEALVQAVALEEGVAAAEALVEAVALEVADAEAEGLGNEETDAVAVVEAVADAEGVPAAEKEEESLERADRVDVSEARGDCVEVSEGMEDPEAGADMVLVCVASAVMVTVAVSVLGPEVVEADAEPVADSREVAEAVLVAIVVEVAVVEEVAEELGLVVGEGVPGTAQARGTTATPRSSCAPPVLEYARVHCTITARSMGLVLINSAVRVTAYSTMLVPSKATLSTLVSAPV